MNRNYIDRHKIQRLLVPRSDSFVLSCTALTLKHLSSMISLELKGIRVPAEQERWDATTDVPPVVCWVLTSPEETKHGRVMTGGKPRRPGLHPQGVALDVPCPPWARSAKVLNLQGHFQHWRVAYGMSMGHTNCSGWLFSPLPRMSNQPMLKNTSPTPAVSAETVWLRPLKDKGQGTGEVGVLLNLCLSLWRSSCPFQSACPFLSVPSSLVLRFHCVLESPGRLVEHKLLSLRPVSDSVGLG